MALISVDDSTNAEVSEHRRALLVVQAGIIQRHQCGIPIVSIVLQVLLVVARLLMQHLDVLHLPVVGVVKKIDLLAINGNELPDAGLARDPAMAGIALDELPHGFAADGRNVSRLVRALGHAQAD